MVNLGVLGHLAEIFSRPAAYSAA